MISDEFRSSTEDDSRPSQSSIFYSSDAYTDAVNNTIEKSRRVVKYPKVLTPFPKISDLKKLSMSKIKKIDPKYIKPPSIYPPVFLKCTTKPRQMSSEETDDEIKDDDEEEGEEEIISKNIPGICKNPTDLDIQFSEMKLDSFTTSSSSSFQQNKYILSSDDCGQTLEEYCNFDEKNLVRVAPHIGRKDVIRDTVDAWSLNDSENINMHLSRCQPIIFGGTFNIDAPCNRNSVSKNQIDGKSRVIPGKHISKTFDIDAPI